MDIEYIYCQINTNFNSKKKKNFFLIIFFFLFIQKSNLKNEKLSFFKFVIILSLEYNKILKKISILIQILLNCCQLSKQQIKIKNFHRNHSFLNSKNLLICQEKKNLYILNIRNYVPISTFHVSRIKGLAKKIYPFFNRLNHTSILILVELIDKKKSIKDIFNLITYHNDECIFNYAVLVVQQRKIINFYFYFLFYKLEIFKKYFYYKNKKSKNFISRYFGSTKFNLKLKFLLLSNNHSIIDFFNENSQFDCFYATNKYFLIKKKKKKFLLTWFNCKLKTILPRSFKFNLELYLKNVKKNHFQIINKKSNLDNLLNSSYYLFFEYITLSSIFFFFNKKKKLLVNSDYFNFFLLNNFFLKKNLEWNHNINFPDIETILIYVVDKDAALHIAKIESLIYYESKRSFLFFFQLYKSVRVIDKLKKKRIIYKKENLYCTLSFFQTFNIENIFSFFFFYLFCL